MEGVNAIRVARPVVLTTEQRDMLESRARARSASARSVERARIVLLAARGMQDKQIAAKLRIMPEKAARWRNRFLDGGLVALDKDAPRPGRPSTITPAKIQEVVRKTTQEQPSNATHWSTRVMAKAAKLSEKSVRRIWHKHGLKPHLSRTFKVSNDPQFAEKLEAIIGLYLNPPEHAIVLCADEKSQIQALDRTQPGLPLKKGRCGTMTHDYKRNGTATLFAALDTLDGSVISMRRPAPPSGMAAVSACDRHGDPAEQADPHDRGQLFHPQTHQGTEVAGAPSPFPCLLHAHQLFLAQHGRALLPRSHRKPSAPRRLSRRRGTHDGHRRVHRQTQPKPQAFHLDGQGHRYPGEGQTLPLVT